MDSLFAKSLLTAALGIFILLEPVLGQARPSFEVATIKPSAPDAPGVAIRLNGPGRLSMTNLTLLGLIRFAYSEGLGTSVQISGGPSWIDGARFDVEGQAEGSPSQAQFRLMMQSLLVDRFGLKTHIETKEAAIYALVPARSDRRLSAKVTPWDGKCNGREPPPIQPSAKTPRCGAFFRPPGLTLQGASMAVLADMLSTPVANLDRVVVDRTGMEGEFNLQLEFAFDPPRPNGQPGPAAADPLAPSLFTALQEQLGLKLESAKGTAEILVVDQATPPTAN